MLGYRTRTMMRAAPWLLLGLGSLAGCFRGEPSIPEGGDDIFQLVVTEAPGGALLGVWVPPAGAEAWIAGGYVGVPAAEVPDGSAGRLLHYEEGRFETVCRT